MEEAAAAAAADSSSSSSSCRRLHESQLEELRKGLKQLLCLSESGTTHEAFTHKAWVSRLHTLVIPNDAFPFINKCGGFSYGDDSNRHDKCWTSSTCCTTTDGFDGYGPKIRIMVPSFLSFLSFPNHQGCKEEEKEKDGSVIDCCGSKPLGCCGLIAGSLHGWEIFLIFGEVLQDYYYHLTSPSFTTLLSPLAVDSFFYCVNLFLSHYGLFCALISPLLNTQRSRMSCGCFFQKMDMSSNKQTTSSSFILPSSQFLELINIALSFPRWISSLHSRQLRQSSSSPSIIVVPEIIIDESRYFAFVLVPTLWHLWAYLLHLSLLDMSTTTILLRPFISSYFLVHFTTRLLCRYGVDAFASCFLLHLLPSITTNDDDDDTTHISFLSCTLRFILASLNYHFWGNSVTQLLGENSPCPRELRMRLADRLVREILKQLQDYVCVVRVSSPQTTHHLQTEPKNHFLFITKPHHTPDDHDDDDDSDDTHDSQHDTSNVEMSYKLFIYSPAIVSFLTHLLYPYYYHSGGRGREDGCHSCIHHKNHTTTSLVPSLRTQYTCRPDGNFNPHDDDDHDTTTDSQLGCFMTKLAEHTSDGFSLKCIFDGSADGFMSSFSPPLLFLLFKVLLSAPFSEATLCHTLLPDLLSALLSSWTASDCRADTSVLICALLCCYVSHSILPVSTDARPLQSLLILRQCACSPVDYEPRGVVLPNPFTYAAPPPTSGSFALSGTLPPSASSPSNAVSYCDALLSGVSLRLGSTSLLTRLSGMILGELLFNRVFLVDNATEKLNFSELRKFMSMASLTHTSGNLSETLAQVWLRCASLGLECTYSTSSGVPTTSSPFTIGSPNEPQGIPTTNKLTAYCREFRRNIGTHGGEQRHSLRDVADGSESAPGYTHSQLAVNQQAKENTEDKGSGKIEGAVQGSSEMICSSLGDGHSTVTTAKPVLYSCPPHLPYLRHLLSILDRVSARLSNPSSSASNANQAIPTFSRSGLPSRQTADQADLDVLRVVGYLPDVLYHHYYADQCSNEEELHNVTPMLIRKLLYLQRSPSYSNLVPSLLYSYATHCIDNEEPTGSSCEVKDTLTIPSFSSLVQYAISRLCVTLTSSQFASAPLECSAASLNGLEYLAEESCKREWTLGQRLLSLGALENACRVLGGREGFMDSHPLRITLGRTTIAQRIIAPRGNVGCRLALYRVARAILQLLSVSHPSANCGRSLRTSPPQTTPRQVVRVPNSGELIALAEPKRKSVLETSVIALRTLSPERSKSAVDTPLLSPLECVEVEEDRALLDALRADSAFVAALVHVLAAAAVEAGGGKFPLNTGTAKTTNVFSSPQKSRQTPKTTYKKDGPIGNAARRARQEDKYTLSSSFNGLCREYPLPMVELSSLYSGCISTLVSLWYDHKQVKRGTMTVADGRWHVRQTVLSALCAIVSVPHSTAAQLVEVSKPIFAARPEREGGDMIEWLRRVVERCQDVGCRQLAIILAGKLLQSLSEARGSMQNG